MSEHGIPHLDDAALNEFLDGVLDSTARSEIDAHLAVCSSCSARLQEIQAVFVSLTALVEKPLPRDLAPGVLAAIRPPRLSRGFRLALAAQASGIVVVLFLVWPSLQTALERLYISLLRAHLIESANTFSTLLTTAWFSTLSALDRFLWRGIDLIDLSGRVAWPWLDGWLWVAAISSFWLIGNGLLLRRVASRSKPGKVT